MAAYKRLNTSQRVRIETLLNERKPLRQIALDLGVQPSTVSREIRTYRSEHNIKAQGYSNRCTKRKECQKHDVCPGMSYKCRNKTCAHCMKCSCNNYCKEFGEYHCPKLNKAPYVCNGCPQYKRCAYLKMMYWANKADAKATALRSECRKGMNITEDEIHELDELISPRIRKGQSLHHIFCTAKDELSSVSERTAYKLLNGGMFTARAIDAPRIVRMSPRKGKKPQVKVDRKCRIGRTYEDFQKYMEEHPDTSVLEGDTVEGKRGGKCILTLTWKVLDFQIGFIRDHNNSASVTRIVNELYEKLGYDLFHIVMPDVWLLDNGSEFSDPGEIEKLGVRVYYCDPSSPFQKGVCENTHSHIRRILPKGTSFDDLDQEFCDLMFSHINSMVRKKLNNHSAYDMFSSLYAGDLDIKEMLNISRIDPKDVELNPSLKRNYLAAHGFSSPSAPTPCDEAEPQD